MLEAGELSAAMPTAPNSKPEWEARLSEAAARIEAELREAVRSIDEEVVPEIRRHSSSALRTLAGKLQTLAEHMDGARGAGKSPDDPGGPR